MQALTETEKNSTLAICLAPPLVTFNADREMFALNDQSHTKPWRYLTQSYLYAADSLSARMAAHFDIALAASLTELKHRLETRKQVALLLPSAEFTEFIPKASSPPGLFAALAKRLQAKRLHKIGID